MIKVVPQVMAIRQGDSAIILLIPCCLCGNKIQRNNKKVTPKLSVLLRVVSSTSNCEELNKLTIETGLIIARELKWVDINFTVHGLLHHSVELIVLNGGWSIGTLSEEALESNNKFIRRYLERFSRKISPVQQLADAISRLLESSDPEILHLQQIIKKRVTCRICEEKHNTTNHKNLLKKVLKLL